MPVRALSPRRRRQNTVYLAAPGQPEREVGPGLQPVIALASDGHYVAWLAKRPGPLMLLAPAGPPARITDNGSDPALAGSLDSNGPVVLAWEVQDAVMVRVVKERK